MWGFSRQLTPCGKHKALRWLNFQANACEAMVDVDQCQTLVCQYEGRKWSSLDHFGVNWSELAWVKSEHVPCNFNEENLHNIQIMPITKDSFRIRMSQLVQMTNINRRLPNELLRIIFNLLPFADLGNATLVCRYMTKDIPPSSSPHCVLSTNNTDKGSIKKWKS